METHGAKGGLRHPLVCKHTYQSVSVMQAEWSLPPVWQNGDVNLVWEAAERLLLEVKGRVSSNRQDTANSYYNTLIALAPTHNSPEVPRSNGSLPLIDILFSPGPANTLLAPVFREPTHIDQYSIETATITSLQNAVSLTP